MSVMTAPSKRIQFFSLHACLNKQANPRPKKTEINIFPNGVFKSLSKLIENPIIE